MKLCIVWTRAVRVIVSNPSLKENAVFTVISHPAEDGPGIGVPGQEALLIAHSEERIEGASARPRHSGSQKLQFCIETRF